MKSSRLKNLLLLCPAICVLACNQGQVAGLKSSSKLVNSLPEASRNAVAASKLLSAANLDSDLWANVTHEDLADEPSQLDIVSKNNSRYNLEVVGCEERPYLTNNLSSIPAGYQFPLSHHYDQSWKFLDSMGSGLFDPHQIGKNNLAFKQTPGQDQFNCFYRVFVPEANASLYLKLVNNIYTAASYSPAGKRLLVRPVEDRDRALKHNYWLAISGRLILDTMAGLISFQKLVHEYPTFYPTGYLQLEMEFALENWTNQINRCLVLYRLAVINHDLTNAEIYKNTAQNLISLNGAGNRYMKLASPEAFFNLVAAQERIYLAAIRYDAEGNRFYLEFANRQGNVFRQIFIGPKSPYLYGEELPNPASEISRLNLANDGEVFQKLFARGKYTGFNSKFADLGDLEQMGLNSDEIISFGAANTAIDLTSLGISAAVSLAFVVVQYYLLQPLINGIFDQPAIGTFSTSFNHLRFEAVSMQDAASWNKLHDAAHQIMANSKLTVLGKNSIFQYLKFSFSDPLLDSQFNLALTIASLTTPWIRYASYRPFGNNTDPYLGCVDKHGSCSDGTSTHKADAVITLTISDNQPSAAHDLISLYRSALYHDSGLEQLSANRLLPVPEYSGNLRTINLATPRSIHPPANFGVIPNGESPPIRSVFSPDSPALLLNAGQELDLMLRIPSPADGNRSTLEGGGFAVRFIEQPLESATSNFVLFINSRTAAEMSQKDSPAINLLMAKFNCQFPLPVGQLCPLQLAIPGASDGRHHQGQLLIADANSQTLALPIYINYRLLSLPAQFSVNQGAENINCRLELINSGATRYARFELNGLPSGSQISRNGCTAGLDSGASCKLEFNFAGVAVAGKYLITIQGLSEDGSTSQADQSQLVLGITTGF